MIFAQTQSLSFYVNAIHNFSYTDNNFDKEKSIKLPILVLPSYALEYHKIKPNKNFGFQASLGVVWNGIRIKRSFRPLRNGVPRNLTSGSTTSGLSPSLRFGIFKQYKLFRIASGLNLRYFSNNNSVGISTPNVYDNESYNPRAETEYLVDIKVHSSLFINIDYKLFILLSLIHI